MLNIKARFRDIQITNNVTPQFPNNIKNKLTLFNKKNYFLLQHQVI